MEAKVKNTGIAAGRKNLKPPWPKGVSGNPKGRARKFVTDMKIIGYKLSEINDAIIILLRLTVPELNSIAKSESHTALERNIAAAITQDIKRGQVVTIETILSRVFGRPKNEITGEIKGSMNVKFILPDNETSDEK